MSTDKLMALEERLVEVEGYQTRDAIIEQVIEDTIEHCSMCGKVMSDEDEHVWCTAMMSGTESPF